ncbi:ABC transporter ATP-binding protein [Pseudaeromonas sp. ZJS20]|uniref:ABC transporter ATP-binding protein n=1 Tax=Pseudaeromonas aegiceratis TaxID=3153928 RepID=UPI00390C4E0E
MSETTSMLQVTDLRVQFPVYGGRVHALNGVNLRVDAGEIVGVVGESGSGKSVTAMLAMQLLPRGSYQVVSGDIRLLGRDVLTATDGQMNQMRGKDVSMIFQEPMNALNPTRKIGRQMVEVIRRHQALDKGAARRKAVDLLTQMQIPDAEQVLERFAFELSGGMRQRVLIAMAFSCEPRLIIADEPTTALDVTVQRQVLALLKHKARADGTAVLFITHDMAVVSQLCDRVYVMYAGQVVESGATASLMARPQHPYTQGLLRAAPETVAPGQPLEAIPGTVPNLIRPPQGCAFANRCARADDRCQQVPSLQPLAGGQVACWQAAVPADAATRQEPAYEC